MKYQFGKNSTQIDPKIRSLLDNYYISLVGKGYVRCTLKGAQNRGKGFYLHRFVMGVHESKPNGLIVDHINRDKLDNRRKNLRLVTYSENLLNASKKPKNYNKHATGCGWAVEFHRNHVKTRKWVKTLKEAKHLAKTLLLQLPKSHGK